VRRRDLIRPMIAWQVNGRHHRFTSWQSESWFGPAAGCPSAGRDAQDRRLGPRASQVQPGLDEPHRSGDAAAAAFAAGDAEVPAAERGRVGVWPMRPACRRYFVHGFSLRTARRHSSGGSPGEGPGPAPPVRGGGHAGVILRRHGGEILKSTWMPDGTVEGSSCFACAVISPCARKRALRPRNRAQAGQTSGIPTSGSVWAFRRPVRPHVLVSDSNGSRSVTTSATLDLVAQSAGRNGFWAICH
jgi:hypothetical protein